MSTASQLPDENQINAQATGENGSDRANVPAPRGNSPPAQREDLSEEERQRLTQLFEQANMAHDLAKDGAMKFCRHSIEAGMALLQAQELCPKGAWFAWLRDHFDGSIRTAQRYIEQAKDVLLMGGGTTDLSCRPSEDVSQLFAVAMKRIKRQRVAAIAHNEAEANASSTEEAVEGHISTNSLPLPVNDDPLAVIMALFDELLTALRRTVESGQKLDYGQFVLEELERIRADVDACRLLLCDARAPASIPA